MRRKKTMLEANQEFGDALRRLGQAMAEAWGVYRFRDWLSRWLEKRR